MKRGTAKEKFAVPRIFETVPNIDRTERETTGPFPKKFEITIDFSKVK